MKIAALEKEKLNEALIQAVIECNHVIIEECLRKKDLDVNYQNNCGNTALHQPVKQNHTEIMKLLLEHGADVNIKNNIGNTALHLGVVKNNPTIIWFLFEHGINVNITNSDGKTAYDIALHCDSNTKLIILLKEFIEDTKKLTKSQLITKYQLKFKTMNDKLIAAANTCNTQKIEALLQAGANVNYQDNGNTTLHLSVAPSHYAVIKTLLKEHANVNITNNDGFTALHLAVLNNKPKIVNIFLDYGANITIKDIHGHTALDYAHQSNNIEIVKLLKQNQEKNLLTMLIK